MDIYNILKSKPHNSHYLNRYIKFIKQCEERNKNLYDSFEIHHICPKSKDMFLEYKNLNLYPWNKVKLTKRQHFIAHLILWKAFPDFKSQMFSAWLLLGRAKSKIYNKIYNRLKNEYLETRYKSSTPHGMTRKEYEKHVLVLKEKEKIERQRIRKVKQEKARKIKEKEKILKNYKEEKSLVCCICCKKETKVMNLKYHYSFSYGSCSLKPRKKKNDLEITEWESPNSIKRKLKLIEKQKHAP